MSEKDEETNKADNRHFFEANFINIIDSTQTRDIGISIFDQTMFEYQTVLAKKYVGKDTYAHDEINETEQALADQWIYNGSVAKVTGRVYLTEPGTGDEFPEEWGGVLEDTEGREYYFLENVALRSQGVEVTSVTDEHWRMVDVRIGYTFSYDDNEADDTPLLIAYPGELAKHQYESPSPAEAELRLSRNWPEEYEIIKQLVLPEAKTSLPKRIALIAEKAQAALVKSEEFRNILEIYLDEQLSLNRQHPYIVTVEDTVTCYDGTDPYDPEYQDGAWVVVSLQNPLTVMAYAPVVRVFLDDHNSIRLDITAQLYSEENNEDPEFVRFRVDTVKQFRSTHVQRSLLSRVLEATSSNDTSSYSEAVDALDMPIKDVTFSPERISSDAIPEHIRDMFMLEKELVRVRKLVVEAKKVLYETEEKAIEASQQLGEEIRDMLIGAGLLRGYQFKFSGPSVLRPRALEDDDGLAREPNMFIHIIDKDVKLVELDNGDDIEGVIESLLSITEKVFDDNDEVKGYKVNPVVIVHESTKNKSLLQIGEVSLVDARVVTRAIVPLDGTAKLEMSELESYYVINKTIEQASIEYGDHQIMSDLRSLKDELKQEVSSAYVAVSNDRLFANISAHVQELALGDMAPNKAIESLEALLVNRLVKVVGPAFRANGQPAEASEILDDEGFVKGAIIDINNDPSRQGLSLVVVIDGDNFVYLPLNTIKDFRF